MYTREGLIGDVELLVELYKVSREWRASTLTDKPFPAELTRIMDQLDARFEVIEEDTDEETE